MKHSQTPKHIDKIKNQNQNLDNVISNVSHDNKVKRAEIKLSAFFAKHNIAFYTADHLILLLKDTCLKPKILQEILQEIFCH